MLSRAVLFGLLWVAVVPGSSATDNLIPENPSATSALGARASAAPADFGPGSRDASWQSSYILNASANNGTRRDIAIGDHIKGPTDDTARVVCPLWNGSVSLNVSMFTDTSAVGPTMKWRMDNIQMQPNGFGASSVAIGDVDNDGQNEVVFGQLNTSGSSAAVALKCAKWVSGAWSIVTITTRTVGSDFGVREVVIGDADNNPATNNEVFAVAGPYLIRATYNSGWSNSTVFTHPSPLNARVSSVTIGNFDRRFGTENCVAAPLSPWSGQYGFVELHYNGSSYDTTYFLWPGSQYWYDVDCGDIDASIPGQELAFNNGGDLANSHAIYQVWIDAAGVSHTWGLYKPATASQWGSYGDIAVGDFCTEHAGLEVVAAPGVAVVPLRAAWGDYYGTGLASSQPVYTPSTGWSCGVAVGNYNKWRGNNSEIAASTNDDVVEIEQSWPTNDLSVVSAAVLAPPHIVGAPASVKIRVQNLGTTTQSNFAVRYNAGDGSPLVTETYTGSLVSGAAADYTFSQQIGCATVRTCTLVANTMLASDAFRPNDTARQVYSVCPQSHPLPFAKDFEEKWGDFADNPPFCGWRTYWTGVSAFDDDWMRQSGYPGKSGAYAGIWTGRHETGADSLISPQLDCTGYSAVTLSCWTSFGPRQSPFTAELRASTDNGATWPVLVRSYTMAGGSYEGVETFVVPEAQNQPAVRFAWIAAGDVYNLRRWLVDDVSVTGTPIVHDAGTDAITVPVSGVYPATPAPDFSPAATVHNYGNAAEPIPATFTLGVYSNSQATAILAPGASAGLEFTSTGPLGAGYYQYKCKTTLGGDLNAANDSVVGALLVIDAPAGLGVSPSVNGYVAERRPTFDWDDLPGVAATQGYQVEVRDGLGAVVFAGTPTLSEATSDVDLGDGLYTWRVRGVNTLFGPWTDGPGFEVDATAPGLVTLQAPANGATNVPVQPDFSWTGVTFDNPGSKARNRSDAADVRYNIEVRDSTGAVVASGSGLAVNNWSCSVVLENLADYTWSVQAYDIAGNTGSWAAPSSFTTVVAAPAQPTLVSPTNGAGDQPVSGTLTWDPAARAATYDVWLYTGSTPVQVSDNQTGTSYDYAGLYNDSVYHWYVVAENAGGASAPSETWDFTTIIAAPGAVTLVAPADNATGVALDVDLTWSAAARADSYDVYFGTDNPPTTAVSIGQTGLSFDCGTLSLVNGTDYYWQIAAHNIGGTTSSAVRHFTTLPLPNAPVLVAPVNNARLNYRDVTFAWQAVGGSAYYWVQVATDAGFADLVVDEDDLGNTDWEQLGMADGHYWWRAASSVDGTVYGPWSGARQFDLDATAPSAAALLTPEPNAVNVQPRPEFSWSAPEFGANRTRQPKGTGLCDVVDRYDLDVSDDNFATFVFQVQLTGTSYTHTADFSFLTRYYWRVRAVDDFGNAGDWSIDSFATVIEAPAAFNLVSPENLAGNVPTSGALTWQASLRASAYDIYLDVADPPVALLAGNVTATTQPYSGLELGTMYYWCVVARNAGGSAQSRTWAFTTAAHTTWPQGWYARDTMPSPQVKDGGALCYNGDVQRVYAIKGNKRDEFYRYSPGETTWTRLADVGGTKPVGKGAAMTTGGGSVFVMKGNATRDFYKFSLADSAWTKAKDIPLALDQTATGGKAVKAGGSLAYVHVRDSDFVYVLKGYGTDFYRYDVARDTHFSLVAAPYTSKPKYDKGSWIVYDGTQYIYVMQSKYNALRRYDVTTEAWDATVLDGMPFNSTVTGKTNKKVGDGSCAAWNPDGGYLFAMKGNGTQEAWKYLPGTNDSWTELESIPQAYSGGKKKKVKSGGGAAYYPEFGTFFVQKGNKTNQFWMCAPGAAGMCNAAPRRDGVSSESAIRSLRSAVSITPNPLTGWAATVRMDLPFAGPALVRVFDASGRCVASREFSARSGASCVGLDLRGLPAGAYLVRVSSPSFTACRKLVVRG